MSKDEEWSGYSDTAKRLNEELAKEELAGARRGLANAGATMPCGARSSAAGVLIGKARRLETLARGYRAMAAVIPREGLSPEAEESIYQVALELKG